MKTIMLKLMLLGSIMPFSSLFAQVQNPPEIKKIEVTGSAEMEVVPDEIYYSISLKEYKDANKKVEIETLEKQLVKAVNEAGIAKENFQIENVYGNRNYLERKRKGEDFLAAKQYVLKLENLYKINDIMAKVDAKGINGMNISRYSHSKIEQYRKELKIKALQAAKEKATYLLAAINEQVGEVWNVQEMESYQQPYEMQSNMMMKSSMDSGEESPEIGFKNIKLRFEIHAAFRIK
jgi:uncharacterized protein YggE